MATHAAEVGQSREDPHRRRTKRDDAKHFDRVTGSPPGEEIRPGAVLGFVNTFNASDLLDQEPERGVDEVLIQLAAADAVRKGDLSHFARHAGAEPQRGSDESLREGKQIRLDGHALLTIPA